MRPYNLEVGWSADDLHAASTALKACKEINPENPIAAAEAMSELAQAVKVALIYLEDGAPNTAAENYRLPSPKLRLRSEVENERIQISPLARAYLSAVRAGQVTEDSPERQLMDAAAYILRYSVAGCTADVLRVVAALCEAVATLKEEPCGDVTKSSATPASPAKSAPTS